MNKSLRVFPANSASDPKYVDYVLRVWNLYQMIRESDPEVTMKKVDNYVLLYAYARGKI